MKTITFSASSLFSKWGFMDGDILDDIIFDSDIDFDKVKEWIFEGKKIACGDSEHGFNHSLLITIIQQKLLPLLPEGFETHHSSSGHNPMRAGLEQQCDAINAISVSLTEAEILEIAKGMFDDAPAA